MGSASRRDASGGVSAAHGHFRLPVIGGPGRSAPTVNDIVREKRGITPEMAARLARYFGTSEQFWLNLQDAFAVHQVKKKYAKELRAIKPLAAAASR
jgi:plasmid maintenance system antidote protein VapI